MKQINTALKTMGIKARVYNQIRKDLYKLRLENITPQQKHLFFDQWFSLNQAAHNELNDYKAKRKAKAIINSLRIANGKLPKKKITKQEYLASQK